MNSLQIRGFVWLLCGLITLTWEAKVCQASSNKNCNGTTYDPERATCCEGKTQKGVSERMSQCCGKSAYNPLNQICCNSTLHVNPSPGAKCCGKELIDNTKQLCCGRYDGNEVVLDRLSPGHQCCLRSQFNPEVECCCPYNEPKIQVRLVLSNRTKCCEKNLTFDASPKPKTQCCSENAEHKRKSKNICCTSKHQSEIYHEEEGFLCCGHHYYNSSLWSCCSGKLCPVTRTRTGSEPCQIVQRASKCPDDED